MIPAVMKKSLVYHPFLFAIYPVLFLFANNIGQVRLTEIIKPLIIVLLITSLLFALFKLLLKDVHKAGFEVALLLLLTFTYGQVNNLLSDVGLITNDPRPLLALWAVFFILGVWGIWRLLKRGDAITRILNVVSLILLIFPIIQIVQFVTTSPITDPLHEEIGIDLDIYSNLSDNTNPPDIYYIVLDAYAREDVLNEVYNYDNSDFLDFLSKNGFYIAEESFTNYIQTGLALSASMNMVYLDPFAETMGTQSQNREPMAGLIQDSTIREVLESMGYKTIATISGYDLTEIKDADLYYTSSESEVDQFDDILLMTTPALILKDDILFKARRDRVLFGIESLRNISTVEGPKFVFSHLMIPHPPLRFRSFRRGNSSNMGLQPEGWELLRRDPGRIYQWLSQAVGLYESTDSRCYQGYTQ